MKHLTLTLSLALAVAPVLSGCRHEQPPPPPPANNPPPPPAASVSPDQIKANALQWAQARGYQNHNVFWIKDHGDRWEVRIHEPAERSRAERRVTVWVDKKGDVIAFEEAHPNTPNWND
jgi:hypothetical protein